MALTLNQETTVEKKKSKKLSRFWLALEIVLFICFLAFIILNYHFEFVS